MQQTCELLNKARDTAGKKGLPASQVLCELLPVCEETVCWQVTDTVSAAQEYQSASLPSPVERFTQRMEVTVTGRRPLSSPATIF